MPPTAGQAPNDADAQAAAAKAAADKAASEAAAAQAAAAGKQTKSADEYEALLKSTREEAAANRVKARELEERLKKIDDEKLSETERLKKQADEARAAAQASDKAARETRLQIEIERQARKLKIVDEEAALKLLDSNKITYDADGKPTNVETLLADLVKAKPYLVGTTAGGFDAGSAANAGRDRFTGPTLTIEQIKAMSSKEREARHDEIMKALHGG